MRSAHLDTGGRGRAASSHKSVGGAGQSRLRLRATPRITTITSTLTVTDCTGLGSWAESELRLSLHGKTEKVKSAEVALD